MNSFNPRPLSVIGKIPDRKMSEATKNKEIEFELTPAPK